MRMIGYMTQGIARLNDRERTGLIIAFHRQADFEDDWFYEVRACGVRAFACQNETGSYTLMLPEEY